MADRFAELLAKGKTTKLTPVETEELARFLNAPILDAMKSPPKGFVSKHKMAETDVVARLKAIDWFGRCGAPAGFDVTMKVKRVRSWPQAMKSCKTRTWENVELEARNQLTMALHKLDRERYQDWNEITDKFKKGVVAALTAKVWEPFQKEQGLDVSLVHCLQWDILAGVMENAYMTSKHGSYFFLELLTVYKAGHFPCGWRGEWPQGSLVIY
jgi:hypothetical protein